MYVRMHRSPHAARPQRERRKPGEERVHGGFITRAVGGLRRGLRRGLKLLAVLSTGLMHASSPQSLLPAQRWRPRSEELSKAPQSAGSSPSKASSSTSTAGAGHGSLSNCAPHQRWLTVDDRIRKSMGGKCGTGLANWGGEQDWLQHPQQRDIWHPYTAHGTPQPGSQRQFSPLGSG
eukprot:XP_001694331.1 predicted protein [Chlamydomonas reinhardtii]